MSSVAQDQDAIGDLRSGIREVPDFPKEGILYYDITTILKDGPAFRRAVDLMIAPFADIEVDLVVGIECRGFVFAAPMAYLLGAGLVPIRKLGKLPAETITQKYELEYATNTLELHTDAIVPGQRVLLVDDLLATGGTASASLDMVKRLGGIPVGVAVLVELEALRGRERLSPHGIEVTSFVAYQQ